MAFFSEVLSQVSGPESHGAQSNKGVSAALGGEGSRCEPREEDWTKEGGFHV